jgi:hypothetical protein
MLCAFGADFIVSEVECGQCLQKESSAVNEKDKKTFTVLVRKVSARYLAPWSPILLFPRVRVVSVCAEKRRSECERNGDKNIHWVISESISQIKRPFGSNYIVFEVECDECLCEKNEDMKEKD